MLLLAAVLALGNPPCPAAPVAHPDAVVEVHPGIELIAIMAWLAERYPTPPDSRYKADVWRAFGKYAGHPALAPFQEGQLFPDITETGLWLGEGAEPVLTLPDTSSWYKVLGRERVTRMLEGAVRFAKDTRFAAWHRQHQGDYDTWTRAFAAALDSACALSAVRDFYLRAGSGAPSPVTIYLEPLNGWGAHMIDLRRLSGVADDHAVRFTIGPDLSTSIPTTPVTFALDDNLVRTIWHEVGHGLIRPWLARSGTRADGLAWLFDSTDARLRQQNITTWRYALEENVVRAVVAAIVGRQQGDSARVKEATRQAGRGFVLVPALAGQLALEYVPARERYADFDRFADRLLDSLAARPR